MLDLLISDMATAWEQFNQLDAMGPDGSTWHHIVVYELPVSEWLENQKIGFCSQMQDDFDREISPLIISRGRVHWSGMKQGQLFHLARYLVDEHTYRMLILKFS